MENIDKPDVVADETDEVSEQPAEETAVEETEAPEVDVEKLQAELDEANANAAKYKRIAERKAKKGNKVTKTDEAHSDELDYGQKAYLNTKDIAESEHDFVQEQLEQSGLPLNELLDNGYFKSKLQEIRDKAVVAEATPSGTRGKTESPRTKPQYWLDKGELPPNTPENRQLRADVVNARIEYNKSKGNFTDNSIVEG